MAEMRVGAENCEAEKTGNENNQQISAGTVLSAMTPENVSFYDASPTLHFSGISVGCRRLDWQRIPTGFFLRGHIALHEYRCAALLLHLDFSQCW